MELFDEEFYVEKKRRIANNKSNKYRRRSSIDASIEKYLESLRNENKEIIAEPECEISSYNAECGASINGSVVISGDSNKY